MAGEAKVVGLMSIIGAAVLLAKSVLRRGERRQENWGRL